jgi:Ser-tRNA(Ala) deacylase AlaX
MATTPRTHLSYQHDGKLYTLDTYIISIQPFPTLDESNRALFKQGGGEDFAIVTKHTVFHPQGGGQPSDVGVITNSSGASFNVLAVRMDAVNDGQVLHFGHYTSKGKEESSPTPFGEGEEVKQAIHVETRLLYSRFHTAGHVLGAAVRHLLEKEVEGFDELKASHFPDSASCEFQGLIDGKWKEPIQKKVNEYVEAKMPVEVEWWDEEDFRKRGLERLIPDPSLVPAGEKFRVVNIVGAEVYPCGGTHVDTTDLCGGTTVKKISRSKGKSRVSYLCD